MSAPAPTPVDDLLPAAARALWQHLPVLAVGSLAVSATAVAALVLGGGPTPLGLLLVALTAGPLWAALVATTDEVVLGGDAGCSDLARNLRRHGAGGARVALVPASATSLTALSLQLHATTAATWLLAPLAVGCVVTSLTVVTSVAAVPLRVELGLRGRALWSTAAGVVAGRPLVPLGVLALVLLGVLAGTSVLASLVLLVPGPVALAVSAGVWTAAGQLGLAVPLRTTTP